MKLPSVNVSLRAIDNAINSIKLLPEELQEYPLSFIATLATAILVPIAKSRKDCTVEQLKLLDELGSIHQKARNILKNTKEYKQFKKHIEN